MSQEELEVLDDMLRQVEEKYPDLNDKVLKRTKRFGVMSWITGWGVYSNWRQIKGIKKKIKKLYEQNLLQEQQIQDLAHYLIQICLTSQGGLCVMNQVLHPVETVEWCVYALFIQDEERIKRDCSMNFKP